MSFPFKKILCPVDFDASGTAGLEAARKIAASDGGKVYLLNVVPLSTPTGLANYVDLYEKQKAAARAKLADLAQSHLSAVDHEIIVDCGDPVQLILGAEKRIPADVIVMGTHGRRGIGRMLLGSVVEAVVRQASCPVLTVHANAESADHADAEQRRGG